VYQSGRPRETTGEVVAAVKRQRESRRQWFDRLLDRMQQDVERFREQLLVSRPRGAELVEVIRDYERCLEELGVVPASVREVIAEIEAVGGAAKISGAGALTGEGAGCLLVFWPDGPPSLPPPKLTRYRRQPVVLGAAGLQVEELQ
jgi:mevalonate kinase